MSKYSPIWEALKNSPAKIRMCAISAPVKLHPRIIKAVIAQKYKDDAFRMRAQIENKRYKIQYVSDGARIRFFLREYTDISNVSLSDLTDMETSNDDDCLCYEE